MAPKKLYLVAAATKIKARIEALFLFKLLESMFRRPLLLLLTLLTLSACQDPPQNATEVESLLPPNTVWFAELNDWDDIYQKKSESRVWSILSQVEEVQNFEADLSATGRLLGEAELEQFLNSSDLFMANVLAGANRYNWVLMALNKDLGLADALKGQSNVEISTYAGEEILSLPLSDDRKLFVHQKNDYCLLSTDAISLEAIIRQQSSNASIKPEFLKLQDLRKSKNNRAPLNLYLKLDEWNNYLSTLGDVKAPFVSGLGDWLLLDLESEKHDLIATGLLSHNEEAAFYTQALAELRSDQISAQKIIPFNCAQWVHMSVGNIGQYQRAYENYLERAGRMAEHQEILKKLPSTASETLAGIIDSEMGTFQSGRAQNHAYDFAYFNVREIDLADQSMESFADSSFIEGYRGHVIRKLAAKNLLPRLYGMAFDAFHEPYYLIHENFVILGNELPALKVVLNDIIDNKTLDRSESYLNMSSQLAGRAQMQILFGLPEWLPNQRNFLNRSLAEQVETHQDSLQNLRWALVQLKAGKERSFVSAMVREEKPIEEKIVRQWTVQLEGQPMAAPQFLRNHNNQKLDIAIQDEDYNLYLISRKGKLFWKQALDGPIMGDIRQIDIYRNNKLQMVFNTANKLWVLDRLGRNVEGFPIDLPSEATAPLGVFNYDQARNYRLVVPCGGMLHNYDVEGKVVEGWKFEASESDIVSEPQFFSVAGKDIIVCLNEEGKLFQLNRRGEERFKVDTKVEELKTSFYLKAGKTLQESELIAGSNSGKMYVINPEGKVDALYLDKSHPADYLIYFEGRYIFSDGEGLYVKDDENPFEAQLEDDISVKPKAMILGNRFYAAAFSAKAEEIRLYNQEGELVEGFPVFAQGPFDMGSLNRDKSLNIVTYGSDGTVICYRLR